MPKSFIREDSSIEVKVPFLSFSRYDCKVDIFSLYLSIASGSASFVNASETDVISVSFAACSLASLIFAINSSHDFMLSRLTENANCKSSLLSVSTNSCPNASTNC